MSYVVLGVIEAGMDTNDEVRHRRLARHVSANGGLTAVAKQAKLNRASLDQIQKRVLLPEKKGGIKKPRSLGDAAARKIEEAYKLTPGWMDWPLDAVDYDAYSQLTDLQKGAVQARMMAEIEKYQTNRNQTFEVIPVGQNAEQAQDNDSERRPKVSLASSQPEPRIPKGANLGTFGEAPAKPKGKHASNQTDRVRKQRHN